MRLIPLIMAALVTAALYFWIVAPKAVATDEAPAIAGDIAGDSAAQPDAAQPAKGPLPVKVVAFHSVAGPVQSAILLRGRTEAHRNVVVRAETSGLVVSDARRAGEKVTKDEILCRLDIGARAAQLAEAEARRAKAMADNKAAEQLSSKGYISEIIAISRRAELQAAEAQMRKVQLDIKRLEIRAPFNGVLESDTAEIGSLLQPGGDCGTVIALNPIKLVGFVPEIDVDKLAPGMAAGARLISGQEISGRITFVSRSADPDTRTFRVELTAANESGRIRDGMTAEIIVPLSGEIAHMAPQAALTLDDSGRLGVRLADNGVARFAPVEILRDEVRGVWLTGLPAQADIIIVGQEYVSDGRAVEAKIIDWRPEGAAEGTYGQ